MTGVLCALVSDGGGRMPAFGAAGAGVGEEADVGGSTDVAYPAGISAGNVLILHCLAYDGIGTPTISTPAGWTSIASVVSADTLLHVSSFIKEASGSESGSLTVSHGGTALFAGRMYKYDGGRSAEAVGSAITDSSGTGLTAVNVTTLGVNRQAVQLLSAFSIATTIGDISGESGADYAEAVAEFTYNGAGGLDVTMSIQDADVATPAAITGGSATLGAAGTYRARIGFAIKP